MRIDVHAHHYPRDFTDAYARLNGAGRSSDRSPALITLAERIDLLDEAGVDLQVLSVGGHQPAFPKRDDAVAGARFANDLYADACRSHGGRFAAFGAVPLPHVDAAIEEIGRCLDDLRLVGINVGCSIAGRPLDDPEFQPFFAELDRRQAVLFLHPCGIGLPMSDPYGLDWMVGACVEDTVTSLRLIMSGLTTRFPSVKIIVPHLGGTLPFLMQRIDDSAQRLVESGQIAGKPSDLARSLYFDSANGSAAALRCSCEVLGADRIVLGSDYPFRPVKESVTYVEESGLPVSDVEAVLDRTAARLLGLDSALASQRSSIDRQPAPSS